MKKIFTFALLLLSIAAFAQKASSSLLVNKPVPNRALVTAQLIVMEVEENHKTILCGDGVSPLYWRFRVPDSKWDKLKSRIVADDSVTLTYYGLDLSNPETLALGDHDPDFQNLPVLQSITVFKPEKLF